MCTELDKNGYRYESTSTGRRVQFGSGYQYKGESPRNFPAFEFMFGSRAYK